MNSLTVKNRIPQLRAFPVRGYIMFRYERMVSGRWVPCNHSRAMAIVGVWRRRGESLCENLTDGSKTTTVSPSALSDGSRKPAALSTCVKAMSMSVSARLSSFSESSGK